MLSQPLLGLFNISPCGGEEGDVSDDNVGEGSSHTAGLLTDSAHPARLPGCCYCCCWTASDILSELSQAWIIGSWNQLKHEPADEGSCYLLNCWLTVKKSVCGGVLLPSRWERWPTEQLAVIFISKCFCAGLHAPDRAQGSAKAALRTCSALHLTLS